MKILVTGAAGFIGFHTSKRLLEEGHDIVGLDNVNDYYSVELKNARLELLNQFKTFKLYRDDLADNEAVAGLFKKERPERVIHLGAQAGVRYSLDHPHAYIQSNVIGTLNILEGCRHNEVEHLVYASTSSVYGLNTKYPFSVHDCVNHPVSLYGATKKDNELMAHSYAHLYKLPVTGLRFFTVYGPWGRPDMALFIFTKNILEGRPIDVFNRGDMVRDFTYVDDIVEGVVRVVMKVAEPNPDWDGTQPDPASSPAPCRVYNIGSNSPVKLMDFVHEIEKNLGKKAELNLMPFQLGDFHKSHADVSDLIKDFGYKPKFNVQTGVKNFVDWYTSYYSGNR
jgi:UDP-glucuronate 4-epimerase